MKTLFRHLQFSTPQSRPSRSSGPQRWPVWLVALLLCAAFGCANTQKRSSLFAKNKKANADQTKTADGDESEDEMSQLEVGAPLKAFRINPDYGWVVVRSAKTLVPGQRFSAWHGDEETAQLVVDERSRHPYYILEVTAGEPHPNDAYTPATE